MAWKKGQSGNPKGRKTVREEIAPYVGAQELCRPLVAKAVKRLETEMGAKKSRPKDRIAAASRVIDIAEPRAVRAAVNVKPGDDDRPDEIAVTVTYGKDPDEE